MNSYEFIASKTKASIMDPENLNSICSSIYITNININNFENYSLQYLFRRNLFPLGIICSPAITRQNLSNKPLIESLVENKNDEDDTHFFETLKNKIKTSPLK